MVRYSWSIISLLHNYCINSHRIHVEKLYITTPPLPPSGEVIERSYTPVLPLNGQKHASSDGKSLEFMIKLYNNGQMSQYLSELKVGKWNVPSIMTSFLILQMYRPEYN